MSTFPNATRQELMANAELQANALELVRYIASLPTEEEKSETDGWENDDAWEELMGLISQAREITFYESKPST